MDEEFSDRFLKQNAFYVQYEYEDLAYLYFGFNKDCEVGWVVAYVI